MLVARWTSVVKIRVAPGRAGMAGAGLVLGVAAMVGAGMMLEVAVMVGAGMALGGVATAGAGVIGVGVAPIASASAPKSIIIGLGLPGARSRISGLFG